MNRRPLVFVSGPYRANTERGIVNNIREAEYAAIEVWKAGGAAICPHLNTAHFGGILADSVWLEGDLEILRRCDGMLLIGGWAHSAGAMGEYEYAKREGIPYASWANVLLQSWIASLPDRWSGR